MGSMSEDEDSRDLLNSSRKKKFNGENEMGGLKGKKIRIDEHFGICEEIDDDGKKEGIGDEAMDFEEEMNLNGKEASCSDNLHCFDKKGMGFDLNVALINSDDDLFVPEVVDTRAEIIDIPSSESEDEEVKGIVARAVKGKGKLIEEGNVYEFIESINFGLGTMEGSYPSDGRTEIIDIPSGESEDEEVRGIVARNVKGKAKLIEEGNRYESIESTNFSLGIMEGSSYPSDGRTNTREEKGKAKVVDYWLSLATNPNEFEIQPETHDLIHSELQPGSRDLIEVTLPGQNGYELEPSESNVGLARRRLVEYNSEMERRRRRLELRRSARMFARWEDHGDASSRQEKPPMVDDTLLEKSPGPFSTALKMVRDRKSNRAQQLIMWKPSNYGRNAFRPLVPSLLDLSMKALAANAEAIVSLELVPDLLKRRLASLICNLRKMNIHIFELLVRGSPTEIHVKDCSWLTEEQFLKTFGYLDTKDLMVLQLELCGQCTLDSVMKETLARCSMPNLRVISLKGACRLSDKGLEALVTSTPALQSINLSQCSLLTDVGINILAHSLGSKLRELYIDDCQKIDVMLILPALKKLEYLEVLSVAGIQTVSDQFIDGLITACGKNLKQLDFANCLDLTNCSLRVIGETCTGLHSLNISSLDKLTDLGLKYLADGCRNIRTLKFCRNEFSDEAIAAFLEASGESLMELSLNNVISVGSCTAFSLAKCSRKLLGLDLSWCRKITDEALGLIVDSCLSLKLLKLFGCTQITNAFLNGHSNPQVQIIGLQLKPILESTNVLEPSEDLFSYYK